jgi:hypothetical protein
MSRNTRSALIIRPGALGDAVLTLPVLHALRAAGCSRLLILGQPSSWRFLAPRGDVRVADLGAPDWLRLFADDAPLSSKAQGLLTGVDVAVVYLTPDRTVTLNALVRAGIGTVLGLTPPTTL